MPCAKPRWLHGRGYAAGYERLPVPLPSWLQRSQPFGSDRLGLFICPASPAPQPRPDVVGPPAHGTGAVPRPRCLSPAHSRGACRRGPRDKRPLLPSSRCLSGGQRRPGRQRCRRGSRWPLEPLLLAGSSSSASFSCSTASLSQRFAVFFSVVTAAQGLHLVDPETGSQPL